MRFNNHGRFIRISEFASSKMMTFLIIPKGERGKGWKKLKQVIPSLMEALFKTLSTRARQNNSGFCSKVGPLNKSFVSAIKEKGSRREGALPVGKWAKAAVCEWLCSIVDWAEARHTVARLLDQKGTVSISPFMERKEFFCRKNRWSFITLGFRGNQG